MSCQPIDARPGMQPVTSITAASADRIYGLDGGGEREPTSVPVLGVLKASAVAALSRLEHFFMRGQDSATSQRISSWIKIAPSRLVIQLKSKRQTKTRGRADSLPQSVINNQYRNRDDSRMLKDYKKLRKILIVALIGWTIPVITVAGPDADIRSGLPQIRAPLAKTDRGTFVVPVNVNDAIVLDFIVDSKVADVTIPADVFAILRRIGILNNTDILGIQTYILADGSKSRSPTFNIRSLKVGGKLIENVRGSVPPPPNKGSLVLGQSYLGHFKSWSIDSTTQELVLEPEQAK